jgi:D-arabinose 1-dehydrogenase-like Zn-dependent alcohol dehydrogenase
MLAKYYELEDKGKLTLKETSLDENNLASDEFFAQTLFSAISPGTEGAAFNGSPPLRPMKVYPRLVGYCNLAKVISIGKNVKTLEPGDFVLTFQSHRTHFIAKEKTVVLKFKENMKLADLSTTYLYHLPFHALLKSSFFPGLNVGVVGLGTLGQATVNLIDTVGGRAFAFSDRDNALNLASELGATASLKKDENTNNKIAVLTNETGLDIIIVTSNLWADWTFALKSVRYGGTICLLGFPGRDEGLPDFNPLHSMYVYDKQLKIICAGIGNEEDTKPHEERFNISRNCRFLSELILKAKLKPEKIISEQISYLKLAEMYQNIINRKIPYTAIIDWNK